MRGVSYKKSISRQEMSSGYIPLLRATNLLDTEIVYDNFVYVPEMAVKREQQLRPGDLVIATSSGSSTVVGKSAPFSGGHITTFGAFCGVLRPLVGINPGYLRRYVEAPAVRNHWSDVARGTNINNLKRQQIEDTTVALPPLAEQERIVEILDEHLSRLEAALALADAIEQRAAAFRRSLLHAAFTGKLTEKWREQAHV